MGALNRKWLCNSKHTVEEVGRWLHEDAVSAKNSRTVEIIAQIAGEQDSSSGEESGDDE